MDDGYGGSGDEGFDDDRLFSDEFRAPATLPKDAVEDLGDDELVVANSTSANHQKWEKRTMDNLSHNKQLTKNALKNLEDAEQIQGYTHRELHANTRNVSHTIKKKINFTEDLVKALDDRIESVDDTMRQVGECLFQLQRAYRSKWAPLNVCERRLELRDSRPLQELIRDSCQDALEAERQTLIESRQELGDQIESMKEMLVLLEKVKNELIEDMQHKRHGLRIDRYCLSPRKMGSGRSTKDRLVLPQLHEVVHYGQPPSPKTAAPGSGREHEAERQVTTRELITKAVRKEEDAMKLCNESDAAMVHTKRECTRASHKLEASLTQRLEHTRTLKHQLEAQLQETEEALQQTDMSIARQKKKLESHEQPLKQLDKQFALRSARTNREGIRDIVHDEMEGHLGTVKRNVKQLNDKIQATQDMKNQLKASKDRLMEDYRCKCVAVKIDDACLKVTPKKAIELDRRDPRGGRCREPSSKGKKKAIGSYEPVFSGLVS
mmetsp:Transcript_102004/g.202514  ORF Transcript_102004/g.202514 Transcript_102004/m.202514 type:complete len:493 (-) Transcript_102004:80-1558(-)